MRISITISLFFVVFICAFTAFPGSALADVIYTIGPGGGYDYETITEAQADVLDKDLVTRTENVYFEVYDGFEDNVTINGWTCNNNYKLYICAGTGQSYPTVFWDNSMGIAPVIISSNYIHVSGLTLIENAAGSHGASITFDNCSYGTVYDCRLQGNGGLQRGVIAYGDDITVDNCAIESPLGIVQSEGYDSLTVSNSSFKNITYYSIYMNGSSNPRVYNNRLKSSHPTSVYISAVELSYVSSAYVYNNLINATDVDISGIKYSGNASNATTLIVNNTIYGPSGPGTSAIWLDNASFGNTYVYNNIVYLTDNSTGLNFTDSNLSTGVGSDNNCVYKSSGGYFGSFDGAPCADLTDWIAASGMDCGSMTLNPRFINTYAADADDWLHIKDDSPCIDNGFNFGVIFTFDVDGESRSQTGGFYAIGADDIYRIRNVIGYIGPHASPERSFEDGYPVNSTQVHIA